MRTYQFRIYQKPRRGKEPDVIAEGSVEAQRNDTIVATNLAQKYLAKDYPTPPSGDEIGIQRWQAELQQVVVELTDDDGRVIKHPAHHLFSVPKKKSDW